MFSFFNNLHFQNTKLWHIAKKNSIPIFLLIIILIIRITAIARFESFTFDELVSAQIAQNHFSNLWHYLRWEMHPPLHFLYLHFWGSIFSFSEIALRISSLFLSVLVFFSTFIFSEKIFSSKQSAIYASLILALSSVMHFYAIWARMYILLLLFTCLSFYFFIKILENNQNLKKNNFKITTLYILTSLGALFTHITALIIPATKIIYLLILFFINKEKILPRIKSLIASFVIIFIVYLPWFVHFIFMRIQTLDSTAWYFFDRAEPFFFFNVILKFFTLHPEHSGLKFSLLLILVFLIISIFLKIKNKQDAINLVFMKDVINRRLYFSQKLILPCLLFITSFILPYALGLYALRYYLIFGWSLFLILGYALTCLPRIARFLIIFFLVFINLTSIIRFINLPSVNWAQAASFIAKNEDQQSIIITAFHNHILPIKYYYQGTQNIETIFDANKFQRTRYTQDLLLEIIRNNYYTNIDSHNLDQLAQISKNYKKIFLVWTSLNFQKSQDLVKDWFLSHGWRIKEKFEPGGFDDNVRVWELVRG